MFNVTPTRVFPTTVSSCHGFELFRVSKYKETQASVLWRGVVLMSFKQLNLAAGKNHPLPM